LRSSYEALEGKPATISFFSPYPFWEIGANWFSQPPSGAFLLLFKTPETSKNLVDNSSKLRELTY
jgi:hypothetical protein